MAGTLFVVATPIGNLEDVTLRALRVLRDVSLIAAEDTRRTARLLAHHAIPTRTISFHQHNVRMRLPQLVGRLVGGNHVALVTDAGTPGISDPGAELVEACIANRIPVDPVPGVSAPLAAAVVSGFPLIPLTIFGFPPRRSKDRKSWFTDLASVAHTVTFFESPHRIIATLKEATVVLGIRQMMVARELTKVHQEFIRGTAQDIVSAMSMPKGEMTVVVAPRPAIDVSYDQLHVAESQPLTDPATLFSHLAALGQLTRREAISETARRLRLPARSVYQAVEKAKGSGT